MLTKKIAILKEQLLRMANIAEDMVKKSTKALTEKNEKLAKEVIENDEPKVNKLEIVIDENAIETIALFQPEAKDLRTVAMIMKINSDLERVGDLSTNIAQFALQLIPKPNVKPYIDLPRMVNTAIKMLDDAISAFVSQDAELARDVCKRDDIVDGLNQQIIRELITFMMSDPRTIDRSLRIIRISENIERIADLATNIGEDVVYIVQSKVIKHHAEENK